MKRVPNSIAAAQLGTAAGVLYVAPAATISTVSNLSFTNTDTVPRTVTMYFVPASGTAGAANEIAAPYSLSAGQTWVPPQAIGLSLTAGASLQASADVAAKVTYAGSVYETTGS